MARKFEERKAKPANDAYTGMLVVSFVVLLTGIGVLYLDYSQYGDKPPPKVEWQVRPLPSSPVQKGPGTEGDKKTDDSGPADGKDKDAKKDTPADSK
jgi:hypothetical protein